MYIIVNTQDAGVVQTQVVNSLGKVGTHHIIQFKCKY